MLIQVDTREKRNERILDDFCRMDHEVFHSKLYCGDYLNVDNPHVVVERKKDLREIATNVTSKKATFKAELDKLEEIHSRMVILITQDRIDGNKIESLEDVMMWNPPKGQGTVSGLKVYRELAAIQANRPVEIRFCSRANAAKEIVKALGEPYE